MKNGVLVHCVVIDENGVPRKEYHNFVMGVFIEQGNDGSVALMLEERIKHLWTEHMEIKPE